MKGIFWFCLLTSIGLSQSLTLTWTDNSSNEDGFGVERSLDGTNFSEIIGDLPTNTETYEDSNISYDTTYWYRVYAFNDVGNSGFSNTDSGLDPDPGSGDPPTAPQNITYEIVMGSVPPPPTTFPLMDGLSFNADLGQIEAPFIIDNTLVYQPSQTSGVENGGLAGYSFEITQAGHYRIIFMTDAFDGGSDSFYVNVDAEPVLADVFHIVPLTSGIEARYVSDGPPDGPTVPREYNFTVGIHDLYIRGREGRTELQFIHIVAQNFAANEFDIFGADYYAVAPVGHSYIPNQDTYYGTNKFNSLSAAEASLNTSPTNPQVINIIGNWTGIEDSSALVIDGTNSTDANQTLIRVLGSARHNGIPKSSTNGNPTGYKLKPNTIGHTVIINDPYVILQGLEIVQGQSGVSDEGVRVAANDVSIDSCIVISESGSISGQDGIHITHATIHRLTIINSLILNWYRAGITIQYWDSSSTASSIGNKFINNTIVNCGIQGDSYSGGLVIINSSGSSNISAEIYNNLFSSNNPNLSLIGSGLSINQDFNITNQSSAQISFLNEALKDYHILPTSTASDSGTNRSSDGFTHDIDLDIRESNWDIGMDEVN